MRSLVVLAVAAAVLACDESTTEPDPIVHTWQAELSGQGDFEEVTGTVSIESGQKFAAEIEITGASPEQEYSWHVATGTCSDEGTIVGKADDYAALETDEEGAGSASATVSASLDKESDYHAVVYFVEEGEEEEEDDDDDVVVLVACGDLSMKQ